MWAGVGRARGGSLVLPAQVIPRLRPGLGRCWKQPPPLGVRSGTPPHPPDRLPGHGPTRAGLVLVNPRFLVAGLTWVNLWLCAATVVDVAWLKSCGFSMGDCTARPLVLFQKPPNGG